VANTGMYIAGIQLQSGTTLNPYFETNGYTPGLIAGADLTQIGFEYIGGDSLPKYHINTGIAPSLGNTNVHLNAATACSAWSNTSSSTGTADTGYCRNAAGVVEINSGTPGTLRDLKLRTLTAGKLVGGTANPGVAAGTGAGSATGGTCSLDAQANDSFGTISCTTGTVPTASATIVTITFTVAYTNAHCTITAASAATASLSGTGMVFPSTANTTAFTLTAGSAALTPNTTYVWNYACGG
jgi:hypothetical protein